jgi:hypothetical protein
METGRPPVPEEIDAPCDTLPAGIPWFVEPEAIEASTRSLSNSLDRLEIVTLHRMSFVEPQTLEASTRRLSSRLDRLEILTPHRVV